MAVYNLFELLKQTSTLISEGHSFAEISILPAEEDLEECLEIEVGVENDFIQGVTLDATTEYDIFASAPIDQDTLFSTLTIKETILIKKALEWAIANNNDCLKNSKLSHSEIDSIKTFSAQARNLLVKIEKQLKNLE